MAETATLAHGARTPRVFLCRDHTLDTMLDQLADDLALRGVEVLRGLPSTPGQVAEIAPELCRSLVGDTDVAMFSSRWRCTRQMLLAAPRLRAIVNPTIGLETVDVAAASELGIIVGHGATPENSISMAEASVMLMLNLMYGLRQTEDVMFKRRPKPQFGAMHARMLGAATVGLVGLGRIGRAVMERLLGFGARLIAYSPHADPDTLPAGVELVDLDTLMRESDIVGIFIAVRQDNRRMIDARALSLMKKSAYLVNVARGDAIDEPALIDVLTRRCIAGAALDTFAVEPLPDDSPLRLLDNVILTPHSVGHTRESVISLGSAALENITRVLRGQLPLHCKNPEIEDRWRERLHVLAQRHALSDVLIAP